MKLTYIKDFNKGMTINGFFICKKIECKLTRLGDEYLDLILQDKTGIIRGKVWSYVNEYKSISEKDVVAIKGAIIEYNKTNEINISYINIANEKLYKKYGLNYENLIIKVDENIDSLEKYLINTISSISVKGALNLKKLVKDNILKIKKIPSLNKKYNLYGGYLLEIIDLLKLNKKLSKIFEDKDENIIIITIIIKNIGLIHYYNDDLQFSVSELGEENDIKLLSIKLIDQYFAKNEVLKNKLQNFILNDNLNKDANLNFVNALYDFNNAINILN